MSFHHYTTQDVHLRQELLTCWRHKWATLMPRPHISRLKHHVYGPMIPIMNVSTTPTLSTRPSEWTMKSHAFDRQTDICIYINRSHVICQTVHNREHTKDQLISGSHANYNHRNDASQIFKRANRMNTSGIIINLGNKQC